MKIIGKAILLCCCSALLACSNAAENKTGSASENPAETSYSSKIADSEESTLPLESSEEKIHAASWKLTGDALEETKESKYLEDFEFSISDDGGSPVSFYGDYVQQGNGEYEGMMQFKKNGIGLLECRTLLNGVVTLDVYKKVSTYGGEDHDFTGVPDFYVSNDLTSWNALKGSEEEGPSNNLLYTFEVANAYFKFTTKTGNALYLNSVSFSPSLI